MVLRTAGDRAVSAARRAGQRDRHPGALRAVDRPHSRLWRDRVARPRRVLRHRVLRRGAVRQARDARSARGARGRRAGGGCARARHESAGAARQRPDPPHGDDGRGVDPLRTRQPLRLDHGRRRRTAGRGHRSRSSAASPSGSTARWPARTASRCCSCCFWWPVASCIRHSASRCRRFATTACAPRRWGSTRTVASRPSTPCPPPWPARPVRCWRRRPGSHRWTCSTSTAPPTGCSCW